MTVSKLSDYALIGNSRSAALVSRHGSIDWCCLPEFHSPSIFAAILDDEKGGHFSIHPAGDYRSSQQYITDTNVVETRFLTAQGEACLTDAFTAMSEEEKNRSLFPDHEILRIIEGVSGTVTIRVEYKPRVFYGKHSARIADLQKLGIHFSWKENTYVLLSTLAPEKINVTADHTQAIAEFSVNAGERIIFSLACSGQSPAVLPELKTLAAKRMQHTIVFWQNWIRKCQYTGMYNAEVRRSALVLKLLLHAPSGSIVAAPTTSLPERLGGERNWDYRYCWLRDASFTMRALVKLGFEAEAHAYMSWILHATQLTRPELQVVYSVYGHARIKEERLPWLSGYANSRPVRIGNGADVQFQLDVYGEVLDAVYTYAPLVEEFDRDTRKFIIGLGKVICETWNKPDNGIWEIRSACVHHTHSKVLAWVGLTRLLALCDRYQWHEAPLEKFKKVAKEIVTTVEHAGYNNVLNCYTRELDGKNLDASLLTLPLVEYCDAHSPRMVSTLQSVKQRLSKNGLIYRYKNIDDGIAGEEGSFGVCNFWLVENLAKSGHLDEAVERFETMVRLASPAGLLSEEIDPESFELLGNYPQGFTHIGLINAALSINEGYKNKRKDEY